MADPHPYQHLTRAIAAAPRRWLVTGAAGFIASSLVEHLLQLRQHVVALDNFSTGHRANLEDVRRRVGPEAWARLRFIEGDVRNRDDCRRAVADDAGPAAGPVEVVLHQAALGSVPRSIEDPQATHASNVDGFLNLLVAAKDAGAGRFVYASSSSVYGDHPGLPAVEEHVGRALSPYAVSKHVDELYANVFGLNYGMGCVGLRYFNVFGPRQDPAGAYAAVIPRWIGELLDGKTPTINGDGTVSRDFCYVENVVQANLLAGLTPDPAALGQAYNVAVGGRMTLNELFRLIRDALAEHDPKVAGVEPNYGPSRAGDVLHSQGDISKARRLLGYEPTCAAEEGLRKTVAWYARNTRALPPAG